MPRIAPHWRRICFGLALGFVGLAAGAARAGSPGDLNGDGLVNADDVSRVLYGITTGNPPVAGADLSGDSVHDAADMTRLILAGARTEATWTPGTEMMLVEQTIGFAGGTITGPAGTPLEGVAVEFRPGALRADSTVRLGYDTGNIIAASGRVSRQPLVLHVNENPFTVFDEAVNITLPITAPAGQPPGTGIQVPYYLQPDGSLEPMTVIDIDRSANTVTFETFHASTIGSIWDPLTNCDEYQAVVRQYYASIPDGFQIPNSGSTLNATGECFGMTAFSAWYERNYRDGADFYPRFMEKIGTTDLTGQDIIATRAFNSITRLWRFYIPIIDRQRRLSEMEQFAVIRNVLQNTDDPVLIYLANSAAYPDAAHAILAYGILQDACNGTVYCYDPNFPGTEQEITLTDGLWVPYAPGGFAFRRINYNGHGSVRLAEAYNYILEDAAEGFQGTNKATIQNLAPASESSSPSRTVTVSGVIQSGEILVSALRIHVGSSYFDTAVPVTGTFSVPVSLEVGRNTLTFETFGVDADNVTRTVPNSMEGVPYVLNCTDDSAALLVTLTWNTGDTDLDLYVYDPSGGVSWYGGRTTADGGELDFDDTTGFGPEHWTLTYNDTVRFNETYRVRVHYYSDHQGADEEPISSGFFVVMQFHENQPNEYTTHVGGGISVDNSSAAGPSGQGASWRDVADMIPVQAAAGRGVEWIVVPITDDAARAPYVAPENRVPGPAKGDWTLE